MCQIATRAALRGRYALRHTVLGRALMATLTALPAPPPSMDAPSLRRQRRRLAMRLSASIKRYRADLMRIQEIEIIPIRAPRKEAVRAADGSSPVTASEFGIVRI